MFTDDIAEKFKARFGEIFRPSNGTEGMIFFNQFCDQCKKISHCEIIGKTMALDMEDPGYPTEWLYGEDGQPCCTAFEQESVQEEIKFIRNGNSWYKLRRHNELPRQ
nr:hypothetical protein [uncultured Desulfobacter sp.]